MADDRSMETSLVYQGVGMLLLCVLFFAGWCVGCRRRPGVLDDLNAPLLSYVFPYCVSYEEVVVPDAAICV